MLLFWEYINGIFVAVCKVSSCPYGPAYLYLTTSA
jgi:hypothetical protein